MKRLLKYLTKPLTLFYIVFIYIIIFSFWWSFLLFEKNTIAFEEKVELRAIGEGILISEFLKTKEYSSLYEKFSRQRIMIITEGITFLILIVMGLFIVRKSFIRELEVASQQRNFLLSITHELKSPLAGIKISIQTLLRHKLKADNRERLLNNSMQDVERLEGLVENILLAAKFDNPSYGFAFEAISLSSLLKSAVKRVQSSYPAHRVNLHFDMEEETIVWGDKLALTSVIINLVENAFKYSSHEDHPEIDIELGTTPEKVILKIRDNGPGIALKEREKIFEKFYRTDHEKTRNTKGTGLGLFIVKKVVDMYDGSIKVSSNKSGGSTFTIYIPNRREEGG